MKRKIIAEKRVMINSFIMITFLLLIFGCSSFSGTNIKKGIDGSSGIDGTDNAKEDKKIKVIVSILPQKFFVEAIGKELVSVEELIPPGGSPATYELKPKDIISVENAQIYFRIGHIPFEKSYSEKISSLNPNLLIIDTSENVKLRYFGINEKHEHDDELHKHDYELDEHNDELHKHDASLDEHDDGFHEPKEVHGHDLTFDENQIDPHIWLSISQVKKQVDSITEALSSFDQENQEIYKENAEILKIQLDELNQDIKDSFKELDTNKLMVFHPAWGYFCEEYGLEQIAIEQNGKEPTIGQLQNIIDTAKAEDIKVIFVQTQFNKEIPKSIAEEIGASIVSIDPLSEDYINNLRSISDIIRQSQKQ